MASNIVFCILALCLPLWTAGTHLFLMENDVLDQEESQSYRMGILRVAIQMLALCIGALVI